MIEHLRRVAKGGLGAFRDLLEVGGCAVRDALGRNVERNRRVGDSERIHPGVEPVELALDGVHLARNRNKVVRRGAVDPEKSLVIEHDVEPAFLDRQPARALKFPRHVAAGRLVGQFRHRLGFGYSPRVGEKVFTARVHVRPLGMEFRRRTISRPEAQFGGDAVESADADHDIGIVQRNLAERHVRDFRPRLVDYAQRVLSVRAERNGVERV